MALWPRPTAQFWPASIALLTCVVSEASFPTLIRRLYEVEDEEGEAARLADDMLSTLGFSEYGKLVGREALGLN
jgi:geranylgeranyl pyrophosphate synthase